LIALPNMRSGASTDATISLSHHWNGPRRTSATRILNDPG
jgi:hypothetical protein